MIKITVVKRESKIQNTNGQCFCGRDEGDGYSIRCIMTDGDREKKQAMREINFKMTISRRWEHLYILLIWK